MEIVVQGSYGKLIFTPNEALATELSCINLQHAHKVKRVGKEEMEKFANYLSMELTAKAQAFDRIEAFGQATKEVEV